ncbi:MAG: MoaD/ThiS family protein [Anaerolineae bacterium]
MRVRVKLYASLSQHRADVSPGQPLEMELPDEATVGDLVNRLKLPQEEVRVAFVNGRARHMSWPLQNGDEVGIFPPVGGG